MAVRPHSDIDLNFLSGRKRTPVFEQILEHFMELMRENKLKPGDQLLSERELAMFFRVSRASLREALHTMEMLGLIRVIPGQGAHILSPSSHSLSTFFGLTLSLKPAISGNIHEMRIVIECGAVSLATRRASQEELGHIKSTLDRMPRKATGDEVGAQADFDFHNSIIKATHNDILIFIYEAIDALLRRSHLERRIKVFNIPGILNELVGVHERIYEAMAEGKHELAEERMREHFRFIQKYH